MLSCDRKLRHRKLLTCDKKIDVSLISHRSYHLLYHDEQTHIFCEIENLFDKIISVNGFIKKNHTTL